MTKYLVNLRTLEPVDVLSDFESEEEAVRLGNETLEEHRNYCKATYESEGTSFWKYQYEEAEAQLKEGCAVLTPEELFEKKKKKYTSAEACKIDETEYYCAARNGCNLLKRRGGFTMFVGKIDSNGLAMQYGCTGERFYKKLVDTNDRSTWIDAALVKVA